MEGALRLRRPSRARRRVGAAGVHREVEAFCLHCESAPQIGEGLQLRRRKLRRAGEAAHTRVSHDWSGGTLSSTSRKGCAARRPRRAPARRSRSSLRSRQLRHSSSTAGRVRSSAPSSQRGRAGQARPLPFAPRRRALPHCAAARSRLRGSRRSLFVLAAAQQQRRQQPQHPSVPGRGQRLGRRGRRGARAAAAAATSTPRRRRGRAAALAADASRPAAPGGDLRPPLGVHRVLGASRTAAAAAGRR